MLFEGLGIGDCLKRGIIGFLNVVKFWLFLHENNQGFLNNDEIINQDI